MTRTALQRVRAVPRKLLRYGNAVECPCCGSKFRSFETRRLPNRRCWTCGSLERHRAISVWLDDNPSRLRRGMAVLHVAPDRALRQRVADAVGTYVSGDLERKYGPERIDVTDIHEPDEAFDAVICSHVLEHVPDDRTALAEIRRVLRPGGWAILNTPIVGDTTDEDPSVSDPAERQRRFGQHDHVRLYGWDYLDRLCAAGLEVETWWPEDPRTVERYRLAYDGVVAPLILGRRV
jgi:SAM-dependent methyltransferase